jgi:hypothetical protein
VVVVIATPRSVQLARNLAIPLLKNIVQQLGFGNGSAHNVERETINVAYQVLLEPWSLADLAEIPIEVTSPH